MATGSAARLRSLTPSTLAGMPVVDFLFWVISAAAVVLLATQAVQNPAAFVQTTVFGLADGAMYALVALGYTMVYGIIELINFAHGDVFTLGGYIAAALLGFFALNEDTFTVQVRDANGRLYSLQKGDLEELGKLDVSVMPAYDKTLSQSDIDQLVSYLSSLKATP